MYKDQEMYVPFSENVQFVQIAMSGSHMPSYMHAHYDGIAIANHDRLKPIDSVVAKGFEEQCINVSISQLNVSTNFNG